MFGRGWTWPVRIRSVGDLVPYREAVGSCVLLQDDGLLLGIRLGGLDQEALDHENLAAAMSAVSGVLYGFESLQVQLGFFQRRRKWSRDGEESQDGSVLCGLGRLERRRLGAYTVDTSSAILFVTLPGKERKEGPGAALEASIELAARVAGLLSPLRSFLSMEVLSSSSLLGVLSDLLSGQAPSFEPKSTWSEVARIVGVDLGGAGIQLAESCVSVASLRRFPEDPASILGPLGEVDGNLTVWFRWRSLRRDAAKAELEKRAKQWRDAAVTLRTFVENLQKGFAAKADGDAEASHKSEVVEEASRIVARGEQSIGELALSIWAHGPDAEAARRLRGVAVSRLVPLGYEFFKELRVGEVPTFAANLPGAWFGDRRELLVSKEAAARLLPLPSAPPNEDRCEHPSFRGFGAPLLLVSRRDEVQPVPLGTGDSWHTLLMGGTGSGKSHFLAFLIQRIYREYPFSRFLVIDRGGSLGTLCSLLRGELVEPGTEGGRLAPIRRLGEPEELRRCREWVQRLFEARLERSLEPSEVEGVGRAFRTLSRSGIPNGFDGLRSQLESSQLRQVCAEFCSDGVHGDLFAPENEGADLSARLVVVEMAGLRERGRVIEDAVADYVLCEAEAQLAKAVLSFLVFEEFLTLIERGFWRDRALRLLRTLRKDQGALLAVIQDAHALFESEEVGSALLTNMSTVVHCGPRPSGDARWDRAMEQVGLTAAQREQVGGLQRAKDYAAFHLATGKLVCGRLPIGPEFRAVARPRRAGDPDGLEEAIEQAQVPTWLRGAGAEEIAEMMEGES